MIVTRRGAGCDGCGGDARGFPRGRAALAHSAKPCGPDTPTLVSSWRDGDVGPNGPTRRADDGGYQARYTGESAE
jgi:hypothetical protein